MKVKDRPYAGNWSEDFINKYRTTRSWTPDAIVTFNGETTLPGCPTCKNKIDFSRFINAVNVSGGIDGSNSCDITLKIPWSYGDSVYKDGRFVLVTGIEVFVYYRGFFQVKELALKADNIDLDNGETLKAPDVETRPYYPVFHGVISGVGVDYSDGAYSVSISTRNMLSFWDNQQINTQQGYFAANPSMARGSINLKGHVYTNMTPHQIIYDLYLDAGGSAEGTGFALRKSSNITARTHTGGPQDYSLMMRYLEQRFRNGMYGLRMYGASGRMYSALETQIISFPETTKKKEDAEYRKVIKQQNKPYSEPKSKASAYSRMVAAGLIAYEFDNAEGGRILRTVDGRQLAQISEKDKTGLSVLSLKPFVTDISNFAQVAFFESSMESKKSIAQRVCDVTGYEFYQDMDGDLVFKPPMYNMDTSSDRVYNIYREDIVSISYSHSEPEATYITMKGSHFRNFEVGIGGEWGVKGVYVDYALVAKYGWKSAEFDSTYYNTARQAYYAAAVELDRQNKNTEGCDITIPLRPEIKPGYPVYVEENDCFYYVESVSHSFSYGGSCTTTLSLVCQRKKFIPPGMRDVKYRDDPARAVNLGATELPEKYIYRRYDRTNVQINTQSSDQLGEDMAYKKITGFPNVVMAFDHQNANPSMLYFDPDFQNIGRNGSKERERYLNMIVNEAIRLKLLSTDPNDPKATIKDGPWMLLVPTGDGSTRKVPLGVDKDTSVVVVRADKKGRIKSVSQRKPRRSETSRTERNGNYNIAGINTLDVLSRKSEFDGQKAERAIGRTKNAKKAKEATDREKERREGLQKSFQETIGTAGVYEGFQETTGGSNEATIIDLMFTVKSALGKGEGTSPLQNLMSALQDRKSSFAPKALGFFRYYSSSHPSPEHQGPDLTEYKKTKDGTMPTLKFNEGVPDEIRDNVVVASPEGDGDTVMFGNNEDTRSQIVRGLLTRTMYSSGVEYVPTKDILALSFQISNNFSVEKVDGPTVNVGLVWNGPNTYPGVEFFTTFYKRVASIFSGQLKKKSGSDLLDLPSKFFLKIFNLKDGVISLEGLKLPTELKDFPPSKFFLDEATEYFSSGEDYAISDPKKIKDRNIKRKDKFDTFTPIKSRQNILKHFTQVVVYHVWSSCKKEFPNAFSEAHFANQTPPYSDSDQKMIDKVRILVSKSVGGFGLVIPKEITISRDKINISSKKATITPIFPISDAKGYEVFGAYQYGRGLRATRGTLFDALLKQDPTRALTPTQIDDLIESLDNAKGQTNFKATLKEAYLERLREIERGPSGESFDFEESGLKELDRIAIGLGLDGVPRTEEDNSLDLNALANRLMTRSDEQIITNIPSALAEIFPSTEGNEVCECRIHNTDAILLEGSLNLDNFLEIENPLLRSVRNMTEAKADQWREHQTALRGENIQRTTSGTGFARSTGFGSGFDFNSRSGSRLIQPLEDVDGDGVADGSFGFSDAVANVESGLEELSDQQRQARARAERDGTREIQDATARLIPLGLGSLILGDDEE